jgi:Kelch motif
MKKKFFGKITRHWFVTILAVATFASAAVAASRWVTEATLPDGANFPAVQSINGLVYVAGGVAGALTDAANLQVYDPATNTWTVKASLPAPVWAGDGAAEINGLLYLPGGLNPSTGNPTSGV